MADWVYFWFRRDLRLDDNAGLYHALRSGYQVQPIFIFDSNILADLPKQDQRVVFIHRTLAELNEGLSHLGSSLRTEYGKPTEIWGKLIQTEYFSAVYTNYDFEPYAKERDAQVQQLLNQKGKTFHAYKDHVLLDRQDAILTQSGQPYTVFTPYKRKFLSILNDFHLKPYPTEKYFHRFLPATEKKNIISLAQMNFEDAPQAVFPPTTPEQTMIEKYQSQRDYPALESTSKLGIHLRFGTISIRKLASYVKSLSETFLSELIWRDFYASILDYFPHVVTQAFKKEYNHIQWLNDEKAFERWCNGMTGYPLVDAGMRELNETGYMHNRVRMVTASFLTKHLLIDWRWGEKYFAEKLLDFDLASNNGGWQWAAGSGCDAAPYFRIFNPTEQAKKFDPDLAYIRKWVLELESFNYPKPIVEHTFARNRALETYKRYLKSFT